MTSQGAFLKSLFAFCNRFLIDVRLTVSNDALVLLTDSTMSAGSVDRITEADRSRE